MKWRTILFAGLAGALAGYTVSRKRNEWISPEKALNLLKEKASEQYTITGAWILVNREETRVHNLPHTVYKGGFSHSKQGSAVHYEFLVDASTGTLLQLEAK
ncbi:PepSY domain-containing protein [Fictibacillus nanhaiensis]|uniref:PepSY domain-containing protein n=1 Tax=Fictibacillus nanhaiensis TaxID=742169 RepID=UPI001C95E493|nr:PepSY domain-containing protein [Fictibacillus nanhaiensis]MBY6035141.1 PepSY domain-containing protein [Fictibacillus nanhaiensis]